MNKPQLRRSVDQEANFKDQSELIKKHSEQFKRGSSFEKIIKLHRKKSFLSQHKTWWTGRNIALAFIVMVTSFGSLTYFYFTYFKDKNLRSIASEMSWSEVLSELQETIWRKNTK